MSEHKLLTQQQTGTQFTGTYFVSAVSIKKTVTKKDYTEITLRDKSGSVFAKQWENNQNVKKGDFAEVTISVEDYKGAPSYIINKIIVTNPPLDMSDYLPCVDNIEAEFNEFKSNIENVKNSAEALESGIEDVLEGVFSSSMLKALKKVPSSIGVFYGKAGSAIQNTNRLFRLANSVVDTYGLKEDEKLVLLACCLLSRVPCVDCYTINDCAPEETKTAKLINFRTLMQMRMFEAWKALKTAPNREWLFRIMHVLGCSESDLKPCTKEAIIFSKIQEIDNQISESFDYIEREECWENGFSTYDVKNGRRYYVSSENVAPQTGA